MDSQIVPPHDDERLLANLTPGTIARRRAEAEVDRAAVVDALLRQLQNGTDVGAFLLTCVTDAQRQIARGYTLTANRPGSWEAALLDGFIDAALTDLDQEDLAGPSLRHPTTE